jgi:predicted DNA-binding protein (MmcQ/YjbR family)
MASRGRWLANRVNRAIDAEWLREICLAFPGTTEQIQWGYDLVFKVAGKMFGVARLEPAPVFLSFKASPESFAELTERPGILPAPYLARAHWVALETKEAMSTEELAPLLRESYDLVVAKLPQKIRAGLAPTAKSKGSSKSHAVSTLARTLAKEAKAQPKAKSSRKRS